ncbi:MAG TPA: efflux RND transporter periplasmic adaptor subunit [Gemmatimonadales bacterium]|nr:efflux RND transporter periplasmic adaptor subunit [Gemmatimonadales bacterium]
MLLAGLAAAVASCGRAPANTPSHTPFSLSETQRTRIHVAAVSLASFRPTVQVSGTVAFDGDHSTQVLAPISGPVTTILVEPGAEVRAGDALAYVVSPDFSAALGAYRKAHSAAVNTLRIATRDSALYAHDAIARQDLEQAQTDAASAAADQDAALDGLRAVGVDSVTITAIRSGQPFEVPRGEIRAPIPGQVVERLITPGQLLQAGTTQCFTIAQLDTVWVIANVFESDLPDVRAGDPATVVPTAGTATFRGRVAYVGAEVDPDTRATAVRIVTVNTGAVLKKDMYVQVNIESREPRTGLLAPVSAVLRDAENLPFVFVAQPDSSFERRPVKLGTRVADRYEITDGLSPGDRVIVEGGLFLQFAESQ